MLTIRTISKFMVIGICMVLVTPNSKALLLGSFIGCNTFGCRLTVLENDVAQLKQQVSRLNDPQAQLGSAAFNSNNNNFRPGGVQPQQGGQLPNGNTPFLNQGQQQQQLQQGQNQQNPQVRPGGTGRADESRVMYPLDNFQNLRRNPNYPISNQFMRS